MKRIIMLILLILLLVTVTACIGDDEVCNYDGICTDDETNGCVDCKDVIGRDIATPDNQVNSP